MSAPNSSNSPSTFDLLRWSDTPPPSASRTPVRISATVDSSAFMSTARADAAGSPPSRPAIRPHQPAGGISSIMLGANLTPEEAEALQKRKPNSELKKREMSGSGIFSQDADLDSNSSIPVDKPMFRFNQPAGGASQISFGQDGAVSPRKPTSLPEFAKQRELSGTLEGEGETPSRKPSSTAKVKELVGSNIFGPQSDLPSRSHGQSLDQESEEATSSSVNPSLNPSQIAGASHLISFGQEDQEFSAMKSDNQVVHSSSNNIFNDDSPLSVSEKCLSAAKRREISGSDIFGNEKPILRDHVGGIRKPPGGESSLTLV